FHPTSSGPVQVVSDEARLDYEAVDLGDGGGPALARREAVAAYRLLFDLERGPLLRARLYRLAERDHVLLLVLHHLVSDAWSVELVMGELSQLYRALSEGARPSLDPLPIQYPDFAVWLRERLRGDELEGQRAYWA